MNDVLEARARIEKDIAGQTLLTVFAATVAAEGDKPAYSDKHAVESGWRTVSWNQLHDLALDVAGALIDAGIDPGEHVAVMAGNRIEHVLADLGSLVAGAVPMSIYNTLAPDQVAYVAEHSSPRLVVVENADHLARWKTALDAGTVAKVLVIDEDACPGGDLYTTWSAFVARGHEWRTAADERGAEIRARVDAISPDQPATILYTSGTTGNPKGVVITHHMALFENLSSLEAADLEGENIGVSYLPFAHIAERTLGMYIPWARGAHVHLVGDPAQLLGALGEVRPTRFFGVPRVWEKIRTGVSAKLAAEPDEDKRAMIEQAMAVGLAWVESQQYGETTPPELQAQFEQADAQILGLLRMLLGLDRCEWAGSAAAPMPLEVARFFAGLGLKIYDIYGMTETCGAVTSCGPDSFRLGTVGPALPGIEVRVADDGEILARGPVCTPGYHLQEEATRALVDDEGWVHTGDIGELDADGFLKVVDRKKELIITSSGKNIAPSNIENYLKESPIIGHAMAIGDSRPYVVAVMTLDGEIAPLVAQQAGVEVTGLADLAAHPVILGIAQAAVDAANARLSRPEQVKRWTLLPTEWTAESAELTPTLKLKRRVVSSNYADEIEALYQ